GVLRGVRRQETGVRRSRGYANIDAPDFCLLTPFLTTHFRARRCARMSRAGKIHAAWRSYQGIERLASHRPRLSRTKFPPNVNYTLTMSKRKGDPAKVGKSLPVKYWKLAAARWRRWVGSTYELCELKCGVAMKTSAPSRATR